VKVRAALPDEFFPSVRNHILPSPAECMDNFLLLVAHSLDGSPGNEFAFSFRDKWVWSEIGVSSFEDINWVIDALKGNGLIGGALGSDSADINLTPLGWTRYEDLQSAKVSSRFAFFARQFANPDLDAVYANCLRPAVADTGYELRTVTQRAGLVDALIEDEIRRCRFLIADLSDDNAGAYWEAGFAEGLGKAVIYICKAKDGEREKRTHFDANHRHTVRWDLAALEETAKQLKAVIRNTLLGDAKQSDN
jgi:hypothetical protein